MSEIKPTPGPWAVARMTPCRVDTASGSISISWSSNNDSGAREREAEANARLIAEAGTVFHNTGLSPVQLVEMVQELKAASKHCEDLLTSHEINRVNGEELADTAIAMLRAALAKCEGVKP